MIFFWYFMILFCKKCCFFKGKSGIKLYPKTIGESIQKPCVFLRPMKKSNGQNLQFSGKQVDKISEIDYIVKSKTNR